MGIVHVLFTILLQWWFQLENANPSTSNGTPLVLDDETKRYLAETIARMMECSLANIQRSMAEMANDITALSLQNNQILNRGPQLNHSRMAKIEFSKFSGDMLRMVYQVCYPMSELKNLKYETTAREYEDAFDSLLSRVEVSEDHVVSLFMGGLPTEIEMGVRMFKPKNLADAYYLTNLQVATLNAFKKKGRSAFVSNQSRYPNGSTSTYQKPLLTTPNISTTNTNAKPNTPVTAPNRRLSQKEYAEKRANNLCFFCD
ncbi:hypothetical protein Tco_0025561 [Tanacetum coccineum]